MQHLLRQAGGRICASAFRRSRIPALVVASALVCVAMSPGVHAAGRPPSQASPSIRKELRAFRLGEQPTPTIDGQLDDAVWTLAEAVEDFIQGEPDNMAPPTERTV